MTFKLHSQLDADTSHIGDFPLCRVLLHKDSAVPWIILVPKRANISEFHHLTFSEQQQFLSESQVISQLLEQFYHADKINLGALGNMVPQLHYHHIARFRNDIAWPKPIWGNTPGTPRDENEQAKWVTDIQQQLSNYSSFVSA